MSRKVTRKQYEEHLNKLFNIEDTLEHTEHCWAGNDKTQRQKNLAKKLANQGLYGTVIKKFDPIGFNTGFNDWVRG